MSLVCDNVLECRIALPSSITRLINNRAWPPLLNIGSSPQALPNGVSLAVLSPLEGSRVSALNYKQPSALARPTALTTPSNDKFTKMIASHPWPSYADALSPILMAYEDTFHFVDCPLGRTHLVTHPVHTGNAPPIHRCPYRVPAAKHHVIQKEVMKRLFNCTLLSPPPVYGRPPPF